MDRPFLVRFLPVASIIVLATIIDLRLGIILAILGLIGLALIYWHLKDGP